MCNHFYTLLDLLNFIFIIGIGLFLFLFLRKCNYLRFFFKLAHSVQ